MPRTSRASRGGFVYHVLNRGNGRSDVFHKDDDFAAFGSLMREAHEKVPMRLTVLRYVERNPLRANMVERSQDWEWSSLKPTVRSGPEGLLCDGPVLKPPHWTRHVNAVQTDAELNSLRHSLARSTPFGDTRWQTTTAKQLGLESSLRPRGRPKMSNK